jgi:hypothetical protein
MARPRARAHTAQHLEFAHPFGTQAQGSDSARRLLDARHARKASFWPRARSRARAPSVGCGVRFRPDQPFRLTTRTDRPSRGARRSIRARVSYGRWSALPPRVRGPEQQDGGFVCAWRVRRCARLEGGLARRRANDAPSVDAGEHVDGDRLRARHESPGRHTVDHRGAQPDGGAAPDPGRGADLWADDRCGTCRHGGRNGASRAPPSRGQKGVRLAPAVETWALTGSGGSMGTLVGSFGVEL